MDMQVANGAHQVTKEAQSQLTFSWLHDQVQVYPSTSINSKASRLGRWSLWRGVAATGAELTIAALPAGMEPALWMVKVFRLCLAIELGGFVLSYVLMISREGQQYIKPRLTHAINTHCRASRKQRSAPTLHSIPRLSIPRLPKTTHLGRCPVSSLSYVSNVRTTYIGRSVSITFLRPRVGSSYRVPDDAKLSFGAAATPAVVRAVESPGLSRFVGA